MVFFICDGCNETLKKNQVDNHARRCYRCDSVTCVDCSITFWGDDYRTHTTCVVVEKDNLVMSVADANKQKKNGNQKLSPQQVWMDCIQTSIEGAPSRLRPLLEQLVYMENVPRKEKQFRNFTANSLNLKGRQQVVESIWKYLVEHRETQKKEHDKQKQNKKQKDTSDINSNDNNNTKKDSNDKNNEANDDDNKNDSNSNSNGAQAVDDEEEATSSATKQEPKTTKTKSEDAKSNDDSKTQKKKVYKAAKKALKRAPGKSMKIKSLRRIIKEELDVPKKLLKELLITTTNEKQNITLQGDVVILV